MKCWHNVDYWKHMGCVGDVESLYGGPQRSENYKRNYKKGLQKATFI